MSLTSASWTTGSSWTRSPQSDWSSLRSPPSRITMRSTSPWRRTHAASRLRSETGSRGLRARLTGAAAKSSDESAIGRRLSRRILAPSLPPSRRLLSTAAARSTRSSASETRRRRPCSTVGYKLSRNAQEQNFTKYRRRSKVFWRGSKTRLRSAAGRCPRPSLAPLSKPPRRSETAGAKSAEISDALQRRAEELTQTLSTVAGDINATLTGRVEDVSRSLAASVDQFKEQVVTPMQDLSRRLDSSRAELGDKVGEHAQQVTTMLDLHKASMGAAFDSHKIVVADATQQSVQIFDARLAALAEAADQSTRIIDVRLADMVEAANRNTEAIDERLVARIQAMSEVLTRAASEAESIWSARGAAVANAIRAKVDELREVIEGKGAEFVTALGDRGDDVSARFVGIGERAMHTLDQQMAGLATLLTRRTDELIAAVNGSASDPVRALSALTGQWRSEDADSREGL